MKTVDALKMRELDRQTIEEYGISGDTLMERAGIGAGKYIIDWIQNIEHHVKRTVILAGKGNNGGDAYVVARYLYENSDLEIVIYSVCELDELSGDASVNADRIKDCVDIKVIDKLTPEMFEYGDIIIDGLLGTGINGCLKEPYDNWILTANSVNCPLISLDIPSGLNGNNGQYDNCIHADLTITMGLPKSGLFKDYSTVKCGIIKCVDIGIPEECIDRLESPYEVFFEQDARKNIKRVSHNNHKNAKGRVLIIGGSNLYSGAPFLAARSALRGGAGLVTVAVPSTIPLFFSDCHSLIVRKINDGGKGFFCNSSIDEISDLIAQHDSLVIGPGIGRERDLIGFMEFIFSIDKPMVIDADALNMISEIPEIYRQKDSNILTPHPGEMRRLLSGFELDDLLNKKRFEQASELAQAIDSTVVLKGLRSVVASPDERVSLNSSGSPALATAGTGDCLAGLIGAFIINKEDIFEAVRTAVFIHGLAGEIDNFGINGLIADDLPELIALAMKKISPFA